jgi:hypothetical protein
MENVMYRLKQWRGRKPHFATVIKWHGARAAYAKLQSQLVAKDDEAMKEVFAMLRAAANRFYGKFGGRPI